MNYPFFSIIIPTYNRPKILIGCLESIALLNYPRDCFELIVVDDGSKTPLDSVVESFKEKLDLKLLRQENAGPAAARNKGVEIARGEYLAFTDDDCRPTPNWLTEFAAGFAEAPQAMLGGKIVNGLSENAFSTASQKLTEYLYEYYTPSKGKDAFFTSNNIAVPTANFKALNGFSTSYPFASEDRDFCDRWNGVYPTAYISQALVYHYHKLSLTSFWKQHFSYGRGGFRFHQIRAQRNAKKIEIEPLSFYFDLLSYPFTQTLDRPKVIISSLFFLSQVAMVAGFFWERLNFNFTETA